MIIVTGGAGFIGSALVWKLNQMGEDHILIVDHLGTTDKWKNLIRLRYHDYVEKDEFLRRIVSGSLNNDSIRAIFHMGACSSTTETDASYLMENNYRYTKELAEFAIRKRVRFIYASSAATYGKGENGYSDSEKKLFELTPLNMYGYSKHRFDLWVYKNKLHDKMVGLKYFNVFGPNEYHKADMRSMVLKAFEQVQNEGKVRLFKSANPGFADGEQVRDFLYIKDAVDMTIFFWENQRANGIFNVGSGVTTSWKQMMLYLFEALEKKPHIEYIDMPPILRDKYQYHTLADIAKLQQAGYSKCIWGMKEAVKDYAVYLQNQSYLGEPKDVDAPVVAPV
jgi:ADP-L-glycero-D-manno-heptose 6-epimerase